MKIKDRRDKIVNILKSSKNPIKGDELANILNVSRQVVVKDIAIIRAEGMDIISTTQGYIIYNLIDTYESTVIKSNNHSNVNKFKKELEIIVSLGGKVKDVIIDHPVYGYIRVSLDISSQKEIDDFINKASKDEFKQLSSLTKETHKHTIEAKNKQIINQIIHKLKEENILNYN